MWELLPDAWQVQDQEDQKCCQQRPGWRRAGGVARIKKQQRGSIFKKLTSEQES